MKTLLRIAPALLLVCLLAFSFAQAASHHNDLSWQAGSGGGQVTGFNVKKSSTKGGPYTTLQAAPATTLTYSDTAGLVEGQHRYYVITATGPGGESAPSNEVDLTTPFSVPSSPTATGTAQ